METTVTRGSQITIAKGIRDKLGIREGDTLVLNIEGNSVLLTKKDPGVFERAGRFLPDNFERTLKRMRGSERERLRRLGIVK